MIVGLDLEPGTYASQSNSDCYWARLSGFGGTLSEIITNEIGDGQQVVTISASDVGFESSGCNDWTRIS